MDFFMEMLMRPEDSYSRYLDRKVRMEERPYGYNTPPPPADSHDYDVGRHESRKEKIERGDL